VARNLFLFVYCGLGILGFSYYIKTSADNAFNTAQCGNILVAVVASVYSPEDEGCRHIQNVSTYSLVGEAIGGIMIVLGIILTATTTNNYKV
jgi:hypothetical protein